LKVVLLFESGTVGTDWIDNRKNLMLFSGRAHPELAEQVAKELDVQVTAQTARDFANGEIFVRFDESVRGCDAFVLQSHPAPLNTWLMEQLLMIDALKRGSAKRITAILPFYPYARQDKKHRTGSCPSICTPIRSRDSSTDRSTTCGPSRC
jgi:ribose-phosphate pyrophosphokinase